MRLHIGFTVNDVYVKYLAVTIASILANSSQDEEFSFYILNSGDISEQSKKNINDLKSIKDFEVVWKKIDMTLFKNQGVNLREDVSIETNFRFLIASLFPSIDRMIFLDADLIALGDLKDLWNLPMDDYYMACRDCSAEFSVEYRQSIGLSGKYYNTGVMLCNLELWRKDNKEKEFFENAEKYRRVCLCLDQDILNTSLQEKILEIPVKWNAIGYNGEFNEETKIAHWPGANKPWRTTLAPFYNRYLEYADLTPYGQDIHDEIRQDVDFNAVITTEKPISVQDLVYWSKYYNKLLLWLLKYYLLSKLRGGKKGKKYQLKFNEMKRIRAEIKTMLNSKENQ